MTVPIHGGAIIDVGNVIIPYYLTDISPANYHSFDFDKIPESTGSFNTLGWLSGILGGNISLVYKATADADGKTLRWLRMHNLTERTGIPKERIRRIPEDPVNGRDKTIFMDQSTPTHYGTTIVIDDRLEVLAKFVEKQVPHLFLFHPQQEEVANFAHTGALDHVRIVHTWLEIRRALSRT